MGRIDAYPEPSSSLVNLTLDGNTSGTVALIGSGTLTLAGGNSITLSQAGNAITISGPAEVTRSLLFEGFAQSFESVTGINGSLRLQPLQVRGAITATEFDWVMQHATAASAVTVSAWAGMYDVVNSTSLNLLSSGSVSYSWSTQSSANYSGLKVWTMPFNMNASRGDYAMGLIVRTSGGGTFNILGASVQSGASIFNGPAGVAVNATHTVLPFLGIYSSSTTALPAAIGAASIMGSGTRARRYDYQFRAM